MFPKIFFQKYVSQNVSKKLGLWEISRSQHNEGNQLPPAYPSSLAIYKSVADTLGNWDTICG